MSKLAETKGSLLASAIISTESASRISITSRLEKLKYFRSDFLIPPTNKILGSEEKDFSFRIFPISGKLVFNEKDGGRNTLKMPASHENAREPFRTLRLSKLARSVCRIVSTVSVDSLSSKIGLPPTDREKNSLHLGQSNSPFFSKGSLQPGQAKIS